MCFQLNAILLIVEFQIADFPGPDIFKHLQIKGGVQLAMSLCNTVF